MSWGHLSKGANVLHSATVYGARGNKLIMYQKLKYLSRKCYVPKVNGSIAFTVSKLYHLLFSNIFTTQCTLVQMRGLGIACRPSVRPSVCLSVCDVVVICDHIG